MKKKSRVTKWRPTEGEVGWYGSPRPTSRLTSVQSSSPRLLSQDPRVVECPVVWDCNLFNIQEAGQNQRWLEEPCPFSPSAFQNATFLLSLCRDTSNEENIGLASVARPALELYFLPRRVREWWVNNFFFFLSLVIRLCDHRVSAQEERVGKYCLPQMSYS